MGRDVHIPFIYTGASKDVLKIDILRIKATEIPVNIKRRNFKFVVNFAIADEYGD